MYVILYLPEAEYLPGMFVCKEDAQAYIIKRINDQWAIWKRHLPPGWPAGLLKGYFYLGCWICLPTEREHLFEVIEVGYNV